MPIPQSWPARLAVANPSEFPALVRELLAEQPSQSRDQALAAVISDWIKRNPQGLRAFLDTLGDDDDLTAQFFAALSSALPYVSDQAASSPYLSELVSKLIEAYADEDPHRAVAWAEEWLLGDSLDEARVTVAGVLAKSSPKEAIQLFGKIQSPLRRVQAISAIGEGYAENDLEAARAWAGSFPHDAEMATAMDGVLRVMAAKDPAGAGAAFQQVSSSIAGKYSRLVAEDRRRRGLPENPPLDAQGNEIINDAGGEDALPRESPNLDMLADSSTSIARGLAENDPAAALRWTDSLPGVLKTEGKRAALSTWAQTQPEEAFRYCMSNQWSDAETFGNIFSSWAEANPETAARQATTVLNERLRGEAISGAIDTWAGQTENAAEVTQWINQLPRESDRNIANRSLASAIDADQPQAAWSRAVLISNPDERGTVLASAFASMVASKPQAAASALASASNLTGEERRRLARMLETGQAAH